MQIMLTAKCYRSMNIRSMLSFEMATRNIQCSSRKRPTFVCYNLPCLTELTGAEASSDPVCYPRLNLKVTETSWKISQTASE